MSPERLKVEVRYDHAEDWGRGGWVSTLSVPREAADFHIARLKKKLFDEAVCAAGEQIAGWTPGPQDMTELDDFGRIAKGSAEPWTLTFEGSEADGWTATVTGPNGLSGEAAHARPHEAVIRALNKALANGARWE